MSSYNKSLFLFHRDLRLQDNAGLLQALDQSNGVIPLFIFDPKQLDQPYASTNAIQFMIESLKDLDEALRRKESKLFVAHGDTLTQLKKILKSNAVDAVFSNKDYTPFAKQRDTNIAALCKSLDIDFNTYNDALLNPPGSVLKQDGEPYTVYTPFMKKSRQMSVDKPRRNTYTSYAKRAKETQSLSSVIKDILKQKNNTIAEHGGRQQALKILRTLHEFKMYKQDRDIPAKAGTTMLSAHNKFGTVSIREVYWAVRQSLGSQHQLINELYWRDFFTHIGYHFPHVFSGSFHKKYDTLSWSRSEKRFDAWCTGQTGFPIVDAGMRELNKTGYMHNRVRMIVASFLTKDLHIDWRKGERYFAKQLVDYDPCVNNGNWQWAASTGCDAQPYFRIFNPWLQQKKFDTDCEYIKQWIPELQSVPNSTIHQWEKKHSEVDADYPAPIVNHAEERTNALSMYKKIT